MLRKRVDRSPTLCSFLSLSIEPLLQVDDAFRSVLHLLRPEKPTLAYKSFLSVYLHYRNVQNAENHAITGAIHPLCHRIEGAFHSFNYFTVLQPAAITAEIAAL